MTETSQHDRAVTLLEQFGLKQYEAKAFVALTRLPEGTAKRVSEISEVPRTRVYDAVRTLESKGLVEIQHANPQQFRAVSIDEAASTLRQEYEERTDSLRDALASLERTTPDAETDVTHEVWSLSGTTAITNRSRELLDGADREVVLVLGDRSLVGEPLVDRLRMARERGVTIVVGTTDESVRSRLQDPLPGAEVFVSELKWLEGGGPGDDTTISRLLLVDRDTILVSTLHESAGEEAEREQAVFGRGFDNGLVTVVRRLMATGFDPVDGSGRHD
jgi:sugar-specific transcriptional regulator TrmB